MNLKVKNITCTLIAGSCLGVLTAQQGGRGPAQTWWVAKTKGGVYIPPNKPVSRLADLKAMHAGQTNWTEVVAKDPEDEAYYYSAAPGTKFGRRMPPDTGALIVWNLFAAAKSDATGCRALQDHLFANPIYGYADPNDPQNPNRGNPSANGKGGGRGRGGASVGPFNPNSVFGHVHPGPAEWWIVQAGQVTGRFENAGEFVGSEGDILYAAPMTWLRRGSKGLGFPAAWPWVDTISLT